MDIYTLIAALLPALILLFVIYTRDKYKKEPIRMILIAFLLGVVSGPLSMVLSTPLTFLMPDFGVTTFENFYSAFFLAAIPEELAKFAMLWLLLRKNKYFDEYMDGIVYAVAISMGFAGIENVLYLVDEENWIALSITRALLSVPMHFACGVIMGYFYSLWQIDKRKECLLLTLSLPILAHGLYDFALFQLSCASFEALGIVVVLIFGIHKLRITCTRLINEHLAHDAKASNFDNFEPQL